MCACLCRLSMYRTDKIVRCLFWLKTQYLRAECKPRRTQNGAHDTFGCVFVCACASLAKATTVDGEAATQEKQKQQQTKQPRCRKRPNAIPFSKPKKKKTRIQSPFQRPTMKGMKKAHTHTRTMLSTIIHRFQIHMWTAAFVCVCVCSSIPLFGCVAFNFKAESLHALNALHVIYVYIMYVFLYTHSHAHFRSCAYNNAGTLVRIQRIYIYMYGR